MVKISTMPPPEDLPTTKINARSSIANYLNNIDEGRYKQEKRLYEEKEPLYQSKSWEEFVRLAISRQYLEKKKAKKEVEVRDGRNMKNVLLQTGKREKNFLRLDRPDDPRLTRAIANLDRTAREYAEGSKGHKSGSRHAHHERVEDNAPRGRSKRGEIVESHHVHSRRGARDHDAQPRRGAQRSITAPPPRRSQMPLSYDGGNDRNPLHGRRNDQAPPQEYVYPVNPPIVITPPDQSRRQDFQPSPQREGYPPQSHRRDYQSSTQRPSPTRSHLSSAGVSYMSSGPPPPAPSPPLRSEFDSHRADRLPERRESVGISASRSGYGYSNRPSDRQSEGRGSDRGSLRDGNSHVGSWVVGSANEESQSGRQRSRQSEVGHQSIRSTSNTHGDERGDTEAIVGLPNWGSGGDEGRVSQRREGRVSESDSRGHERSGSGS